MKPVFKDILVGIVILLTIAAVPFGIWLIPTDAPANPPAITSDQFAKVLEHASSWAQWVTGLSTLGMGALWLIAHRVSEARGLAKLAAVSFGLAILYAVSLVGSVPYMFAKAQRIEKVNCHFNGHEVPWKLDLFDDYHFTNFGGVSTAMHWAWAIGSILVMVIYWRWGHLVPHSDKAAAQ